MEMPIYFFPNFLNFVYFSEKYDKLDFFVNAVSWYLKMAQIPNFAHKHIQTY